MVKNTAPVRRTARSTADSVSLLTGGLADHGALAQVPLQTKSDARSCRTDVRSFSVPAAFSTTKGSATQSRERCNQEKRDDPGPQPGIDVERPRRNLLPGRL